MAVCYYTCNLVPPRLLARFGFRPRRLLIGAGAPSLRAGAVPAAAPTCPSGCGVARDSLAAHPMTCPYVTHLLQEGADTLAADGDALLVVPSACDAMRRAGDALGARYGDRVCRFALPRSADDASIRALTAELKRLQSWLAERAASTGGDLPPDLPAGDLPPDLPVTPGSGIEYPSGKVAGGVLIVSGPLSDPGLLAFAEEMGAGVAGLESCASPEREALLMSLAEPAHPGPLDDGELEVVARTLLTEGLCPRCGTRERYAALRRRLDEAQPAAVIYARQSFCDPGAYDCLAVAAMAEERGLPFLEIEVGFPFELSGPLRTRVEAFLETILLDADLLDMDLLDAELS